MRFRPGSGLFYRVLIGGNRIVLMLCVLCDPLSNGLFVHASACWPACLASVAGGVAPAVLRACCLRASWRGACLRDGTGPCRMPDLVEVHLRR